MFKLHCLDPLGQPKSIYYDPHTSEITDDSGVALVIEDPERFLSGGRMYNNWTELGSANPISPQNPGRKSPNVKALKIQMGLNCNYSCSYCSQAAHLEHGEAVITNIDDAREFLVTLDDWLQGEPSKIELWGGEPFVYWKAMQVLVSGLRQRFPKSEFNVVTNGSLLDDEKFAWVIDNGIGLAVSHDGPGQPLRGPDPLEKPEMLATWRMFVDALVPVGGMSFNTVLTAANCDVKAIRQWFVDRFGEHVVTNFEGVAAVHHDNARHKGDVLFGKSEYDVMKRSIYEAIVSGEGGTNPAIFNRVRDFISSLALKRPSRVLGQKCGMDREKSLAVDLKGNVLTCHNTGANSKHRIGSVADFESISLDTSYHWSTRESCNYCPVLQICQGSCMYLEGDDFVDSCENEYNYGLPFLAGVIQLLWGLMLIDIEGDIRRPKRSQRAFPVPLVVEKNQNPQQRVF